MIEQFLNRPILYKYFHAENNAALQKIIDEATNIIIKEENNFKFYCVKKNIEQFITNDIFKTYYANFENVIVFGATLGQSIDKKILNLNFTSPTLMAITNDICDIVLFNFIDYNLEKNFLSKSTLCPGSEIDFSYNKAISNAIKASLTLGINVNEAFFLLPQKSILGFTKPDKNSKNKCDTCKNKCDICKK